MPVEDLATVLLELVFEAVDRKNLTDTGKREVLADEAVGGREHRGGAARVIGVGVATLKAGRITASFDDVEDPVHGLF